jgi:hypothetical protein
LDKEPVGFSDFTTSIPSNSIPIRQNNIIIQLIIDLAEKLDQIEEQVAEINQFIHNSQNNLPPALVKKLDSLAIANNNNNYIKRVRINPFDTSKWNSLKEKEKK